jgi:hypothetical protein
VKSCAAAIFLILLTQFTPTPARAADIRAGVGYDVISQSFFFDSLTLIGIDSLDASLTQSTTYLDEPKAFVRLGLHPLDNGRLDLTTQLDQTRDLFRAKFYADSRLRLGLHRLQFNSELEVRKDVRGDAEAGEEFLYGSARARADFALGQAWTSFWSIRANFVDFDSAGDLSYNQFRLLATSGFIRTFDDFSSITGMIFVGSRTVPDSSRLDYVTYGLESNVMAYYDNGAVDLTARIERKDYNQPDDEDDYTRLELLGNHKVELTKTWLTRQEIDLEYSSFSDSDLVNVDYMRTRLYAQAGLTSRGVYVWAGPQVEFLTEGPSDLASAADYNEYALRLDIDYMSARSMYAAVEWSGGIRDVRLEDDFQSDFWFNRLTVLGDARLINGLGLNVLFSAEWEWHSQDQENNRLYLLSSSLTYDF